MLGIPMWLKVSIAFWIFLTSINILAGSESTCWEKFIEAQKIIGTVVVIFGALFLIILGVAYL